MSPALPKGNKSSQLQVHMTTLFVPLTISTAIVQQEVILPDRQIFKVGRKGLYVLGETEKRKKKAGTGQAPEKTFEVYKSKELQATAPLCCGKQRERPQSCEDIHCFRGGTPIEAAPT